MQNNKIDIKAGSLFPWYFQVVAGFVFLAGLVVLVDRPILAFILIVASIFVVSGYEGTEIDKAKNTYKEYTSFFLIKFGKKMRFKAVEKLFINTSKTQEKAYTAHTTHSSTFTNVEFNGYIKFADGVKVHLLSKKKMADLKHSLQKVSAFLNTHVEDNTTPH